jgi:hypothetical protein
MSEKQPVRPGLKVTTILELQQSFLKLAIDQLGIPTSTQYLPRDEPHGLEAVDKLHCRFFPVWGLNSYHVNLARSQREYCAQKPVLKPTMVVLLS